MLLAAIGLVVGTIGTLIGAGGGFILMPILLFMYPKESPDILTGISLAVVFFNASSGSIAYGRMKRIDYKSGLIFSLATIPGAILGVFTISMINRSIFNIIFGILLVAVSIYLFVKPDISRLAHVGSIESHTKRTLTDSEGKSYKYSFKLSTGILISLFVGFISSLLGIGGGIIHVPAMVGLLNFPVHIATATSHFVLAIMALVGTVVHILNGTFTSGALTTVAVSIGALAGAQIGARLSNKINAKWIIKALAIALGLVGLRMLIFAG